MTSGANALDAYSSSPAAASRTLCCISTPPCRKNTLVSADRQVHRRRPRGSDKEQAGRQHPSSSVRVIRCRESHGSTLTKGVQRAHIGEKPEVGHACALALLWVCESRDNTLLSGVLTHTSGGVLPNESGGLMAQGGLLSLLRQLAVPSLIVVLAALGSLLISFLVPPLDQL